MNIKEMTKAGENLYAECPPSGRGKKDKIIKKETILSDLKPISLRKYMVSIVGSLATQGESNNDIDLLVRGEDLSDKVKEAIDFRLYRYFSKLLECEYDDVRNYVQIHYNNAGSYTSYIPLFELTLQPISNPGVVEMSEHIPVHLRGNVHIINKSEDNKRVIAGYASVVEIDRENHYIPKETLEHGIQTLLSDTSYSNLMLIHGNAQIGKILKEYNDLRTHVDEKGLFIVAELRNDLETANQTWNLIEDGTLNAFSISGEILLSHDECNDKSCVRVIDKLNIYEVSVCDTPVNEKSGFVVVSKGHESFRNVINKCTKHEVINLMSEEDAQKKEDCEDCKEDEVETTSKSEDTKKSEKEITEKQDNDEEEYLSESEEEISEEPIVRIERRLEALEGMIQGLINQEEPEEELEEEPLEEEPEPEEEKAKKPKDEKEEEPTKYPYPSKKDFDELKNSVNELMNTIDKSKETNELETLIKSKEDEISVLEKKIETLEKAEVTPKTTTETEDKEEESEDETTIKKNNSFSKDSLGTGVWYKNPDK